MEELGRRKGDLQNMENDSRGRTRLEYRIPARSLIGFQSEFMTLTRGTGLMSHIFDDYPPMRESGMSERRHDILHTQHEGAAVDYALWTLQYPGRMFVQPQEPQYQGKLSSILRRNQDLVVKTT